MEVQKGTNALMAAECYRDAQLHRESPETLGFYQAGINFPIKTLVLNAEKLEDENMFLSYCLLCTVVQYTQPLLISVSG
jgi:hypothetical protein